MTQVRYIRNGWISDIARTTFITSGRTPVVAGGRSKGFLALNEGRLSLAASLSDRLFGHWLPQDRCAEREIVPSLQDQ